jgi:hypothetical protein
MLRNPVFSPVVPAVVPAVVAFGRFAVVLGVLVLSSGPCLYIVLTILPNNEFET